MTRTQTLIAGGILSAAAATAAMSFIDASETGVTAMSTNPATRYLARPDARVPRRVTMQGGFLGYHLHAPMVCLPEFENREWVPTFNLNGDRKGAAVLTAAPIADRRFVGKNVCHTIVYDAVVHATMPPPPPDNPGVWQIFRAFMWRWGVRTSSKHPRRHFVPTPPTT